jgi:hypothetical protein
MKSLYLYFAETATPGRGPMSVPAGSRPVVEEPMIPIQPGAFSRWKANRDRVIAENAAAFRGSSVGVRTERNARPG